MSYFDDEERHKLMVALGAIDSLSENHGISPHYFLLAVASIFADDAEENDNRESGAVSDGLISIAEVARRLWDGGE